MSLLNKAAKQVSQSRKVRNAVVEVLGFKLNPDGGVNDQVLVARDIDSGNELNIIMGKAPTESCVRVHAGYSCFQAPSRLS